MIDIIITQLALLIGVIFIYKKLISKIPDPEGNTYWEYRRRSRIG